ncbi:NF038396 family protein [Nesterenkonia massiliensis]|uniref:NF038396 family protein n=1 Tax=Nesterenkonia massiliensis TaxID=1232429 RepID=UPI00042029F1|nr:NF038396 family protein [Nesterenkonia massiliensis]
MTEKPELTPQPAQSGFTNAALMGFMAYLLFPLMALMTVIFALMLISDDLPGAGIALIIVSQVWVGAGIWGHFHRKKLLRQSAQEMDNDS